MSEADAFPGLICRLRGGDARAAEKLFRHCADGRRMQLARAAGRALREPGLEAEDE